MLGGISIWQLLIILLIVIMIFGTKKLRGMGGDLGSAVSGFKKAVKDGADEAEDRIENVAEKVSDTVEDVAEKAADKVKNKS